MAERSKVTSKGQVTIPSAVRNALHIDEGDYLVFESVGEYEMNVRVVKTQPLTSLLGALRSEEHLETIEEIRKQAYHANSDIKYANGGK